ncbi:MAG: TauD/TfdA family dioxygenase, partial [Litorivicinaceae bacterium]|nr:TauD/TfdA family dioxygenase [Litorivicinaceae bacterium]
MSLIGFRAISPVFGAIVEGFDVKDVPTSVKLALNDALDRFGVLVFPNLELTESQQLEMAKVFGEPSKRSR